MRAISARVKQCFLLRYEQTQFALSLLFQEGEGLRSALRFTFLEVLLGRDQDTSK